MPRGTRRLKFTSFSDAVAAWPTLRDGKPLPSMRMLAAGMAFAVEKSAGLTLSTHCHTLASMQPGGTLAESMTSVFSVCGEAGPTLFVSASASVTGRSPYVLRLGRRDDSTGAVLWHPRPLLRMRFNAAFIDRVGDVQHTTKFYDRIRGQVDWLTEATYTLAERAMAPASVMWAATALARLSHRCRGRVQARVADLVVQSSTAGRPMNMAAAVQATLDALATMLSPTHALQAQQDLLGLAVDRNTAGILADLPDLDRAPLTSGLATPDREVGGLKTGTT